jgi:hypothetical protein
VVSGANNVKLNKFNPNIKIKGQRLPEIKSKEKKRVEESANSIFHHGKIKNMIE